MEHFSIRAYGRTELGITYSPELTPEAAWKRLRRWIEGCRPLAEELRRAGYDRSRRIFTPAEVELIFKYLGEP